MYTRLPSSSLRVTGPDRLDFVQGQMTAHLKAVPVLGQVLACFLNHKGQIEFVARIYRRDHDLYLHLWEGQAAGLKNRLQKYIIFDDVQLEDTSDKLITVHVWNENDLSGWDISGADVQTFELAGGAVLSARVERGLEAGLDLHYLSKHEEAILPLLGEEKPLAELEERRLEAGISDIQDRWEGFLPQEVGLERAVSYRKGCYVGQEIMARLEARGNARYTLGRVEGAEVAPYSDLVQGGKVVGRTGASTGKQALARLRKDLQADGGAGGALEVAGQQVSAQTVASTP